MPSPAFTEDAIKQLYDEKARLVSLYENTVVSFHSRKYKAERGYEYAMQGFSRRLRIMLRCVDLAFQAIPPENSELPSDLARYDAEVAIQSFVFNVSGSIDNLAWIWVFENELKTEKGKELTRSLVGLRRKHTRVRGSLSKKNARLA